MEFEAGRSFRQRSLSASSSAYQPADEFEQLGRIDWLGEMGVKPRAQRAPPIIIFSISRDGDQRGGFIIGDGAQTLGQFVPVHLRHANVRDDQIEVLIPGKFQRVPGRICSRHIVTRMFKEQRNHLGNVADVIHDQDALPGIKIAIVVFGNSF